MPFVGAWISLCLTSSSCSEGIFIAISSFNVRPIPTEFIIDGMVRVDRGRGLLVLDEAARLSIAAPGDGTYEVVAFNEPTLERYVLARLT